MTMVNNFRAPVSAAIFDLTVTRNTNTIASALPLPVFGALDYESNYVEIISQDLPAGCVLTSITKSASGKGLRFTYTSGANVDTIDVECAQVPYLNILRSSQGSLLKFSQCKMQISDVTIQAQFSRKVSVVVNTIFGKIQVIHLRLINLSRIYKIKMISVQLRLSKILTKRRQWFS